MFLIGRKPIHPVPPQDAMHRGARDHNLMESLQVRGDPGRPEVIMLAQMEDLADHLARRGSRRSLWRPRPIAQSGVTVLDVSTLPLVERFPGNAESTAYPRDILFVCRLL
jgi:hypothetical protein